MYWDICRLVISAERVHLRDSKQYGVQTRHENNGFAVAVDDVAFLVGRLLILPIFLTSGIGKITAWDSNVAYMQTRHLPAIPLLLSAAALVEVAGSCVIAVGYLTRCAAFVTA